MRFGGSPASCCNSGTVIQSAIASNMEIESSAPSPVRCRAIKASRIACWAYMPEPTSTTDTPTRAGSVVPVIEARPDSAWISMS